MMISPSSFVFQHETDTYEELVALRDEIFADIRSFEQNKISEETRMILPSPDVIYQCNLQYLAKTCELIAERYRTEQAEQEL